MLNGSLFWRNCGSVMTYDNSVVHNNIQAKKVAYENIVTHSNNEVRIRYKLFFCIVPFQRFRSISDSKSLLSFNSRYFPQAHDTSCLPSLLQTRLQTANSPESIAALSLLSCQMQKMLLVHSKSVLASKTILL